MDCCQNENYCQEIAFTADFLRTISEENRLRILCILKEKERCVCEIWSELKIPQNLASHHLKVLRDFNLIESRKEGLNVYYSLNNQEINEHYNLLNKILGGTK
ncbi:TPA: ArsR family transcriptional regulator [Candidatus Berkelbacteria bacterium]|uniref:Regulatory protein ArsR, ArsR family transcriptional regulator n=1 Tax=Berkelbacteria bacterium GW2011_GWE1_39_12 TaxID=1618337 RepID=A0A0G4B6I4_9BACT|nr:MAG: regulatory protein ArsR, ArsR family transcriptional regulator [Berkelbacteria bacterium GW2011_GWE1_39_12]HBO60295.1 ArsR family transcriptional regulator [Candidatus Berkelbacteria bacterium]